MEFDKSKYIKMMAMQKGMCQSWENKWKNNMTDAELADLYIRGLDFCIEQNFPSNEYIVENFDKTFLNKNGIYVNDDNIKVSDLSGIFVVQGESAGEMHFGHYDAATIWVRHESELMIDVHGFAWVFVHVLDDSKVSVYQYGDSNVTIKNHSKTSSVITTGNVKYIEKN